MRKMRVICPFLRGFLPGILVGLFTSLLFFSIWRHPSNNLDTHLQYTERLDQTPRREANANGPINGPTSTERSDRSPEENEADWTRRIAKLAETSKVAIPGAFDLLVLVHSAAEQRSLRDAVRLTWLQRGSPNGEYVARFVIGTRYLDDSTLAGLATENEEHGDLLVLSDVEEDGNAEWPSSWKILQAFSWAVTHVDFATLFKCNSATFVDIDRLLAKRLTPQRGTIWGYFAGGVKAVRYSENSVAKEENWILCSHYLPYPQGGGYIISRNIVELLVEMGPHLDHYRHDDIALGVWLSPLRGIKKQHTLWINSGYYSRGCLNSFVVSHAESVESMEAKAGSLERKGRLCESEYQSRLAYHYNWTVPASRCCVRKVGIH